MFASNNNNNNNLQIGIIINNEVIALNAFIHIFGMVYTLFSYFVDNFKKKKTNV
jgi:hypothetical protein